MKISWLSFFQNAKYAINIAKPVYMWRVINAFISVKLHLSTPIRGIDIPLSYECNINCEHCNVALLKNKEREYLSVEEICELIKEAKKLGLMNITFTGGEPLVEYEKLISILKNIQSKHFLIHIQTNAMLLTDEKIRELKKLGVDKFILSWDPYHDISNWKEMIENRKTLVAKIKKHGLKTIAVAVGARNVLRTPYFLEVIRATKELDVWLVINMPVPLGAWFENEEILLTDEDKLYIRQITDENSHVRLDFDLNFNSYGCPAFTERLHVNAYGDVQPCTFSQISFGNIREESISTIRERGLRTKVYNTYLPYCPSAEDIIFIRKHWAITKKYKVFPIKWNMIFDENGNIKGGEID